MATFDTETTGLDTQSDRIVQAAFCLVGDGEETMVNQWLLNPGVDIPAAATAVHGITTERARAEGGHPLHVLDHLRRYVRETKERGWPLVVCNAPYDLSLLAAELLRHGLDPLTEDDLPNIIDPLVLDNGVDKYRKGSRKLVDLCAHYDARIDGAHDAKHDAMAAARVAYRIGSRFPVVGEASPGVLQAMQRGWFRERAESLDRYFKKVGKPGVDNFDWPMRGAA